MWFMTSINLNWLEFKNNVINASDIEVPQYKEGIMKEY